MFNLKFYKVLAKLYLFMNLFCSGYEPWVPEWRAVKNKSAKRTLLHEYRGLDAHLLMSFLKFGALDLVLGSKPVCSHPLWSANIIHIFLPNGLKPSIVSETDLKPIMFSISVLQRQTHISIPFLSIQIRALNKTRFSFLRNHSGQFSSFDEIFMLYVFSV